MRSDGQIWLYWGKSDRTAPGRYHPLVCHCVDAAAVAYRWLAREPRLAGDFARSLGIPADVALGLVVRLVALHDLGKWLSAFQAKAPELVAELTWAPPPAVAAITGHGGPGIPLWETADVGRSFLREAPDEWYFCLTSSPVVCATLCHHGSPEETADYAAPYMVPGDMEQLRAFLGQVEKLFEFWPLRLPSAEPSELEQRINRTSWMLNGFVTACDWLASNRQWFPFVADSFDGLLQGYWACALEQADRALTEAALLRGRLAAPPALSRLCPRATVPTPLQEWAAAVKLSCGGPNLIVMEDATGTGKTEAALILASRIADADGRGRIAIALPTMATSNAMFARLGSALSVLFRPGSDPTRILAHSGAVHSRAYHDAKIEGEVAEWFAEGSRKALFSSLSVGTIDQFLKAVLQIRYQSLRLLAISRTVLIVDEVHAYDAYMHELLCRLLAVHASYGGSSILLSATLPRKTKDAFFAAYGNGARRASCLGEADVPCVSFAFGDAAPQIEHFAATGHRTRQVRTQLLRSEHDAYAVLRETVVSGACVCWVRNTVRDALAAYRELQRLGIPAELFHSRFTRCDRNRIEASVLGRFGVASTARERRARVLVATQVVEQSLDLDFDTMISDLAPIDLLLQRLGRMRRHIRDAAGNPLARAGSDMRGEPVFYVLAPVADGDADENWAGNALPGTAAVYKHHGQLWLTANRLGKSPSLVLPRDYRVLVEAVYGEDAESRIPPKLRGVERRASDADSINASHAFLNAIDFEQGYEYNGPWPSDRHAVTRLGEPSLVLRLVRAEDDCFAPWPDDDQDWSLGDVSVHWLGPPPEADIDADFGEAYSQCTRKMPDKSKWTTTLPVFADGKGNWHGRLREQEGRIAEVTYNATTGIEVAR